MKVIILLPIFTLFSFSANAFFWNSDKTTLSEDSSQALCEAMKKVDDLEKKLNLPVEEQNIFSTLTLSGKTFMPESKVVSCTKKNGIYKAVVDLSKGGEEALCEALEKIDLLEEKSGVSVDDQTVFSSTSKESLWMPESRIINCRQDGTVEIRD